MSSKDLIPFSFENNAVRVLTIDGEPWFVASDVANALGYARPAEAVSAHCKNAKSLKSLTCGVSPKANKINALPGNALLIQEPDVYRLTFRSELPSAERFQDWLAEEVLPQIRKTGSYSAQLQQLRLDLLTSELTAAQKMAEFFGIEGNAARISANQVVNKVYGVDCMALTGTTHLLAPVQEALLTATEVGNRLGIPKYSINPKLEELGLQKGYRDHKGKQQWELTEKGKRYAVYLDTGKRHGNGTPIKQPKWYAGVVEFIRREDDLT